MFRIKLSCLAILVIALAVVNPRQVSAEVCALDPVPAATLLVPYFEVSVPRRCGRGRFDTEVVVTNASAAPQLANVVVWTEWSVPVLSFQLYLTGYDVDSFRLSDILCTGSISNESDEPITFSESDISHARAVLTGRPSPVTGQCASHPEPSGKATGYITIDLVNTENPGLPTDGASYVSALGFDNLLIGDVYYHDAKIPGATRVCGRGGSSCIRKFKRFVRRERGVTGIRAVAIEAAPPSFFTAGDRTFYGRYLGASAQDRREPLPSLYHVRYDQTVRRKKFELIVWREGNSSFSPVSCEEEPDWHPMGMAQIVVFDSESNVEEPENTERMYFGSFSNESTVVKNALADISFDEGWIYFNFNTTFASNTPYSDGIGTAYVLVRRDGKISTAGVHSFVGSNCVD